MRCRLGGRPGRRCPVCGGVLEATTGQRGAAALHATRTAPRCWVQPGAATRPGLTPAKCPRRGGIISYWIAPLSLLGFAGGPIVSGIVGGGTAGPMLSTVASLLFNLPVFVTAARLVTRGRTDTVTS